MRSQPRLSGRMQSNGTDQTEHPAWVVILWRIKPNSNRRPIDISNFFQQNPGMGRKSVPRDIFPQNHGEQK